MMTSRLNPSAAPARTNAPKRIVEVAGPQRPSLRDRVEHAWQAMEDAALERLRRDVCRDGGGLSRSGSDSHPSLITGRGSR